MEDETFAYYRDTIRTRIWSGFDNEDVVTETLNDWLLDDEAAPHVKALRLFADHEFATKRTAELNWPTETDCDRLDAIFKQLNSEGILALADAGYTTSDSHGDAWDLIGRSSKGRYTGFCYYHGQDVERVVDGLALWLGFDAVEEGEAAKRHIGERVRAAVATTFKVNWNGDPESRIEITNLKWQRRTKWLPSLGSSVAGLFGRLFGRSEK